MNLRRNYCCGNLLKSGLQLMAEYKSAGYFVILYCITYFWHFINRTA